MFKTVTRISYYFSIALQKSFQEIQQREVLKQLDLVYEDDSNFDLKFIETSKYYFANRVFVKVED